MTDVAEFIDASRAILDPARPILPLDQNLSTFDEMGDALNDLFDSDGVDGVKKWIEMFPEFFGSIEEVMPILCAYRVRNSIEGLTHPENGTPTTDREHRRRAAEITAPEGDCELCGTRGPLQIHTVSHMPAEPVAAYDHLGVLCRDCHGRQHGLTSWPAQSWLPPTPLTVPTGSEN